jgi:hypothetical protein
VNEETPSPPFMIAFLQGENLTWIICHGNKETTRKQDCYCWYLSCSLFLTPMNNTFALHVATYSCLVRLSARRGILSGVVWGNPDLGAVWITSMALMENPRPLWAFCQPIDAAANFYRIQWHCVAISVRPAFCWVRTLHFMIQGIFVSINNADKFT